MAAMTRTVSVGELHRRLSTGEQPLIVDVRTPAEFSGAHLAGARNLPLGSPELAQFARGGEATAAPVFVICQSGGRSRRCCEMLAEAGLDGAISVDGGVGAWLEASYEVERRADGRAVIALERQVRIAAGLLVLAGGALGWWVHPGFFGLAALVGAGLVFAGVTDFCGMGLLLARMPWNGR